jgi:hypothetical protein
MAVFTSHPIISGTGTVFWSKANFGPTGHQHSRSSPLPSVSTIPSAYAIFKCVLEVVFCEGVQLRLRLSFDHLNCVKMVSDIFTQWP